MAKILVLHGPNLNRLGAREPEIYGAQTLADIDGELLRRAGSHDLSTFQSNREYELIDKVHEAGDNGTDGIVINPAAFTHTSVALRDALLCIDRPFVEVHLSNVYRREAFRQQSYFSDVALAVVSGMGGFGYLMALDFMIKQIES